MKKRTEITLETRAFKKTFSTLAKLRSFLASHSVSGKVHYGIYERKRTFFGKEDVVVTYRFALVSKGKLSRFDDLSSNLKEGRFFLVKHLPCSPVPNRPLVDICAL